MLSTQAAGLPTWQVQPERLQEVLHENVNFFHVNIGLASLKIAPVPSIAEHPVSEALFTFVNSWAMLFLPVLLMEARCQKVPEKIIRWTGITFLPNVFCPF